MNLTQDRNEILLIGCCDPIPESFGEGLRSRRLQPVKASGRDEVLSRLTTDNRIRLAVIRSGPEHEGMARTLFGHDIKSIYVTDKCDDDPIVITRRAKAGVVNCIEMSEGPKKLLQAIDFAIQFPLQGSRNAQSRQSPEQQYLMGIAVGIIMRASNMDRTEARHWLRGEARSRRLKIEHLAEQVISEQETFNQQLQKLKMIVPPGKRFTSQPD